MNLCARGVLWSYVAWDLHPTDLYRIAGSAEMYIMACLVSALIVGLILP